MDEQVYGSTTEELWESLPEHFRRMDSRTDWAMKKYINLMAEQLQVVDNLVERIDYDSIADGGSPDDTSDLVNPFVAEPEWLPWLGQLFGTYIKGNGRESDRDIVVQAASGFNAGTFSAIEAAAKSVLIGSKFAKVTNFSTAGGAGTFWDLMLTTIESETLKNLYPEIQATISETVTWNIASTGTATKRIVKVFEEGDPYYNSLYNNKALKVTNTDDSNLVIDSSYRVPVTATDWYQSMITIWAKDSSYSGNLIIRYYNASDTQVGIFTQPITIGTLPKQFLVGGNAPATSTYMRTYIEVTGFDSDDELYMAQLAARHEGNDQWIPRTADPVQAVIDRGAKPAGFKLWYGTNTSSWDDILAENPTWDDWEAAGSWTAIEETST